MFLPIMDAQNATFVLGRNKSNKPVDDYVNDSRTNQIEKILTEQYL